MSDPAPDSYPATVQKYFPGVRSPFHSGKKPRLSWRTEIEKCYTAMGGEQGLAAWAATNPDRFYEIALKSGCLFEMKETVQQDSVQIVIYGQTPTAHPVTIPHSPSSDPEVPGALQAAGGGHQGNPTSVHASTAAEMGHAPTAATEERQEAETATNAEAVES